jgi:hypothetical protein
LNWWWPADPKDQTPVRAWRLQRIWWPDIQFGSAGLDYFDIFWWLKQVCPFLMHLHVDDSIKAEGIQMQGAVDSCMEEITISFR